MNRRRIYQTAQLCVALLLFVWMAFSLLLSGCATTTPQVDPSIVAAKEKARQDSLRRDEKLRMLSFANENRKSQQYRKAINQYWRVLELDAEDKEFKDIHRLLGDCYFSLELVDSTIVVYEMGAAEYPDFVHLHRFLAYLYTITQRTDEAINSYLKVLEIEPQSLDDRRKLVDLYIVTDQEDEAIAELQKIVEADPDDQKSQETLGSLLRRGGDIMGYIQQLVNALELDPQNTRIMADLADTYREQNENEKAAALYEKLIELEPENVLALSNYNVVLQNMQRYRDALAVCQKVLDLQPDNARVLCEIAVCYKEMKQFATGRTYCRRAMQKDPDYGYPHIVLGEIYEASVEKCINDRDDKDIVFDDKLVLWFAYEEYGRALNDIEWREYAERRRGYLQTQIPNDDDKFFHEKEWNEKKTSLPCYNWI